MSSAGFKPPFPAIKLQQTYALDRAVTGNGKNLDVTEMCSTFIYGIIHFDKSIKFSESFL